jgi:hypothetical protein
MGPAAEAVTGRTEARPRNVSGAGGREPQALARLPSTSYIGATSCSS